MQNTKVLRKISPAPYNSYLTKHHSLFSNCICNNSHHKKINYSRDNYICSEYQGLTPDENGAAARRYHMGKPREGPE